MQKWMCVYASLDVCACNKHRRVCMQAWTWLLTGMDVHASLHMCAFKYGRTYMHTGMDMATCRQGHVKMQQAMTFVHAGKDMWTRRYVSVYMQAWTCVHSSMDVCACGMEVYAVW